MTLTIEIPLPPIEVSPNYRSRTHHAKTRATAAYRHDTMVKAIEAARQAGWIAPDRATVQATFFKGRTAPKKAGVDDRLARPKDADNAIACLKAAIDGLRDAGVILADTSDRLYLYQPVLLGTKLGHQGQAKVVLEVNEWLS